MNPDKRSEGEKYMESLLNSETSPARETEWVEIEYIDSEEKPAKERIEGDSCWWFQDEGGLIVCIRDGEDAFALNPGRVVTIRCHHRKEGPKARKPRKPKLSRKN